MARVTLFHGFPQPDFAREGTRMDFHLVVIPAPSNVYKRAPSKPA